MSEIAVEGSVEREPDTVQVTIRRGEGSGWEYFNVTPEQAKMIMYYVRNGQGWDAVDRDGDHCFFAPGSVTYGYVKGVDLNERV